MRLILKKNNEEEQEESIEYSTKLNVITKEKVMEIQQVDIDPPTTDTRLLSPWHAITQKLEQYEKYRNPSPLILSRM